MPGIYELGPWESDPNHPGTERRTDGGGNTVLTLHLEGRPGSQCWAWMVAPAMSLPLQNGANLGSSLDKETARRQAEEAAVAYGYFPDNRVSTAPTIARRILNTNISDAARIAQEAGLTFRVGMENGRPRMLTDDRRLDRVTVTVLDGIVTEARPG